jgi:hypothetical protein
VLVASVFVPCLDIGLKSISIFKLSNLLFTSARVYSLARSVVSICIPSILLANSAVFSSILLIIEDKSILLTPSLSEETAFDIISRLSLTVFK